MLPPEGMHSRTLSRLSASVIFRSYPIVRARSRCQTSRRYSGDSRTFVAAESKQDCRGLADKFSALLEQLQQHGSYALMHDETNLFNQQEFLKGNKGGPIQGLVGCVVGYTVAHDRTVIATSTRRRRHSGNVLRLRSAAGQAGSTLPGAFVLV